MKVFLVSALVSTDMITGHRATVRLAETRDAVIGEYTQELLGAGLNILSLDAAEFTPGLIADIAGLA